MNHQEVFTREFAQSGESWLLNKLAPANIRTVFDVGCNRGEWTRMARRHWANADIHTFEVVPQVYRAFLNSGIVDSKIIPNSFGLFDEFKTVDIKFVEHIDTISTMLPGLMPGTMNVAYNMISGIVIPGDAYVKSRSINYIDFVKLDVEGVEDRVLHGLEETLKVSKIGMIQFEFGTANIISKFLLMDYYKLLTPLGFVIGKLNSNGLAIKDYNLTDESFGGFHGIAIHKSRLDLINLLQ